MHPVIAAGMITDMPIGKVERRLEPIRDAIFKLVPKIEFVRIRCTIAAMVKLPCHPVFQLKFALVRCCDLVSERKVTFSAINRRARTSDERERGQRSEARPQP